MKNYLVVDNWYDDTEYSSILKEIELFSSINSIRSEDSIGTARKDGKYLSKSCRFFPQNHYSNLGVDKSPMFSALKKMQTPEFHQKVHDTFRDTNTALSDVFAETNATSTIVNYYENNDYYNEHYDVFQFTVLIWLYKEPKSFTGGDLVFTKINETIECKSNRLVLFPSFYYHAVNPIAMTTDKNGYGRYTITHFYYKTEANPYVWIERLSKSY